MRTVLHNAIDFYNRPPEKALFPNDSDDCDVILYDPNINEFTDIVVFSDAPGINASMLIYDAKTRLYLGGEVMSYQNISGLNAYSTKIYNYDYENRPIYIKMINILNQWDVAYSGVFKFKSCEDTLNFENTATIMVWNEHNQNGVYVVSGVQHYFGRTLPIGKRELPTISKSGEQYDMSFGRKYPLNTQNYAVYEFNFGGIHGLPRPLANAVMVWLACDNVEIDGVRYYVTEDPEWVERGQTGRANVKVKVVEDDVTNSVLGSNILRIPELPVAENTLSEFYFEYPFFEVGYFEQTY